RDLSIAGGGGLEIWRDRRRDVADGPPDSTCNQIQREGVLPIFRTVADRGVENSALTMPARPGDRIRRALVRQPVHRGCVERKNHMKIGGEVLQRIPFFIE